MKFVPDHLRKAADLYEERNALYGDNYKKFGIAIAPLLAGVHLESVEDFNRMGILVQIIAKVTRYCANFERGGHDDSLDDIAVYAIMLKELDAELRQKEGGGGVTLNHFQPVGGGVAGTEIYEDSQ